MFTGPGYANRLSEHLDTTRGAGREADVFFGQDRARAQRFRPTPRDRYARDGYEHWVQLVDDILS